MVTSPNMPRLAVILEIPLRTSNLLTDPVFPNGIPLYLLAKLVVQLPNLVSPVPIYNTSQESVTDKARGEGVTVATTG